MREKRQLRLVRARRVQAEQCETGFTDVPVLSATLSRPAPRVKLPLLVERFESWMGISLAPSGELWIGPCPWHSGEGGAVVVDVERDHWHCEACEIGGDSTWLAIRSTRDTGLASRRLSAVELGRV